MNPEECNSYFLCNSNPGNPGSVYGCAAPQIGITVTINNNNKIGTFQLLSYFQAVKANCQPGLVWNDEAKFCDWPKNVPGCYERFYL